MMKKQKIGRHPMGPTTRGSFKAIITVIIIVTRFSNLEILAKMEEEMEEKERLERGEPPKEKKEEKEETVEGEKETATNAKKEESGQASAVNSRDGLKMSRENSFDR